MLDSLKNKLCASKSAIAWSKEKGEGEFVSSFFRNEDDNRLLVFTKCERSDYKEHAEKCVASFNGLSEASVDEICERLIDCAKDGGIAEDFELPKLESPRDILKYCWFTTLYVIANDSDEISYAAAGEGDWGEEIGFLIRNDSVAYVGTDLFDYMD